MASKLSAGTVGMPSILPTIPVEIVVSTCKRYSCQSPPWNLASSGSLSFAPKTTRSTRRNAVEDRSSMLTNLSRLSRLVTDPLKNQTGFAQYVDFLKSAGGQLVGKCLRGEAGLVS